MARMRLPFAEDEGTLRTTLVRLLGEFPDLEIVAACANGRDALIEALAHRPDVVLTDLRMPRMDGIELTRALREKLPETAVVILTGYDDDESLFAALKAGARGYVLKDATPEEILEAVRVAREGQGVLSSGLVRRVIEEFTRVDRMIRGQRQLFAQLTPREMEVLEALADGLANKQIGEAAGQRSDRSRAHRGAPRPGPLRDRNPLGIRGRYGERVAPRRQSRRISRAAL